MTDNTNAPQVRPAVGPQAMGYALHPAIIVNPQASGKDLVSWCFTELKNLHAWIEILACSRCDFEADPCHLASAINERLAPLVQVFEAAMELPEVN